MMAVVKNLMVRCGADFSALTKATEKAKASISSMGKATKSASSSVKTSTDGMQRQVSAAGKSTSSAFSGMKKAAIAAGVAMAVKQIATEIAGLTKESMAVDAQIQNLTRTMGSNKSAFMSWAKNNAAAFGISESAAVKYGNAYSNLISGFVSDTATSTAYTKQLIESSAVIASRTGRTVEDVSERIRSGLLGNTEAIEDLGINVNVALLETTDAFKQLANGRSWQQLTFQEQQQVRLFSIMEQSSKKFGDSLAGGGATSLMKMTAGLENLKLELGRAFTPLAETVIPILTDFISVLTDGVRGINAFFSALRGDTQSATEDMQQAASGAQSTAGGLQEAGTQAKKLKNALAGIDELNVLGSGSSETTSTGSAVSGPVESVGISIPEPDTSGVKKAADQVKKIFSDISQFISTKFAPTFSSWGKAFEKIKDPAVRALSSVKGSLTDVWENTLKPAGEYMAGDFVPTISNAFSGTFAPIFGETMPVLFDEFAKDFDFATEEIDRASKDILAPAFEQVKTVAVDSFAGIKSSWDEHGQGILDGFQSFKESLRKIWDTIYTNVIKPIFDRIGNTVSWLWDKHLKPLWDNIADFFGAIGEFLAAFWNERLAPFIDFVYAVVGPIISHVVGGIFEIVGTVVGTIADWISKFIGSLSGLLDFLTGIFTGDWKKAWNGLKKAATNAFESMWSVIKGIVNLIIDGMNLLWRGVYSVASGIVNGIGKIAGTIGKLSGQDWEFSMTPEPPLIPKLATGGLAYGPTLAMIGEGRDREAVLPLNPNVYSEIAQGIQAAGGQSNRETVTLLERILETVSQIDPTLVMDGTTLARSSNSYFEAEQRRRGPSLVKVV